MCHVSTSILIVRALAASWILSCQLSYFEVAPINYFSFRIDIEPSNRDAFRILLALMTLEALLAFETLLWYGVVVLVAVAIAAVFWVFFVVGTFLCIKDVLIESRPTMTRMADGSSSLIPSWCPRLPRHIWIVVIEVLAAGQMQFGPKAASALEALHTSDALHVVYVALIILDLDGAHQSWVYHMLVIESLFRSAIIISIKQQAILDFRKIQPIMFPSQVVWIATPLIMLVSEVLLWSWILQEQVAMVASEGEKQYWN